MLYTRTSFSQIWVFISGDRQIFGVFTVLFMKWSQMVFICFELFEIFRKKLRISENIFRWFYVIFVSRPTIKISSTGDDPSAMCLCRQLLDYLLQPFRVLAPTLSAGELLLRKIEGPDRGSTIGLACSRRSDCRAGEKIHEQKKNEGRLEGERGKELSPPFLPPCLFSRGTT